MPTGGHGHVVCMCAVANLPVHHMSEGTLDLEHREVANKSFLNLLNLWGK